MVRTWKPKYRTSQVEVAAAGAHTRKMSKEAGATKKASKKPDLLYAQRGESSANKNVQ